MQVFEAVPHRLSADPVQLPAELIVMIIHSLNGLSQEALAFLWCTLRNVSKLFRAEVEKIFAREYVAGIKLLGNSGMSGS